MAMTSHNLPRLARQRTRVGRGRSCGVRTGPQPRRSPERASSGSRRAPAGCGCPVGNASPDGTGPARALSSQSGHCAPSSSTTQRSIVPAGTAASAAREKANTAWSPARRSVRAPFHSRKAAPTCSTKADSSPSSTDGPVTLEAPTQRSHDRRGQSRGDVVDAAAASSALPPAKVAPARAASTQLLGGGLRVALGVLVLGGQDPGAPAALGPQPVEDVVLVVLESALEPTGQGGDERVEHLVALHHERVEDRRLVGRLASAARVDHRRPSRGVAGLRSWSRSAGTASAGGRTPSLCRPPRSWTHAGALARSSRRRFAGARPGGSLDAADDRSRRSTSSETRSTATPRGPARRRARPARATVEWASDSSWRPARAGVPSPRVRAPSRRPAVGRTTPPPTAGVGPGPTSAAKSSASPVVARSPRGVGELGLRAGPGARPPRPPVGPRPRPGTARR